MAQKKTLDIVPVQRWRVSSIVRRPDAFFSVTPTMPCIVQKNETVALFPFSETEDLGGQLILGVPQLLDFVDDPEVVSGPSQEQNGDVSVFRFWPFSVFSFAKLVQLGLRVDVVFETNGRRRVLSIDK
ncbi:MAG: hypothetical protein L6R38_006405 [Xanthoria sp. 2 TBL-2021]|nr:MAG: hypothetical protein L6R38_006405 [Xanthoria sp. 2 TBL-2021]